MVMSILAGLQFFFAGWAGINALNHNPTWAAVGALGMLTVAAAQVGAQFWVRGQVTPTEDAPPGLANGALGIPGSIQSTSVTGR